MKAIRLRVEYLSQPLGLGIAKPRFYWNCEGGEKQTAYQIVCKRSGETLWDSGRVESSAMTHILYEGAPLHSRDRVTWSVGLWDENGNPGDVAESSFELGLLKKEDWQARWITGDYKPENPGGIPLRCCPIRAWR